MSQFNLARVAPAVALVACLLAPPPTLASAEQREALAELAKEVKKFLDGKGEDTIVLGTFEGTGVDKTGAGPCFVVVLGEELKKLGVKVANRGKFGAEGRYSMAEVPASNPDDARIGKKVLAVKVKLEFYDDFDNRDKVMFDRDIHFQGKAEQVVKGPVTLLQTFAPSTPLPPGNSELENDELLRKHLIDKKGKCAIDGTLIRSAAKQPFAIELVVNKKSRTVTEKDGQAFVDIKQDENYAVRVYNFAPFEVGVQLSIDGLSMFAFSDLRQPDEIARKANPKKGEPLYSVLLVPRAKEGKPGEILIEGWHRNNKPGGLHSFRVMEYAKSAAAKLSLTKGLGTIVATFQASGASNADLPDDEPSKRRGGLGDATGFGPPAGGGLLEVKRELGVVRDCISVRYTRGGDK